MMFTKERVSTGKSVTKAPLGPGKAPFGVGFFEVFFRDFCQIVFALLGIIFFAVLIVFISLFGVLRDKFIKKTNYFVFFSYHKLQT